MTRNKADRDPLNAMLNRLREESDRAIDAAGSTARIGNALSPSLPPRSRPYARWLVAGAVLVFAAGIGGAVEYNFTSNTVAVDQADELLGPQVIGPDEVGSE